MQRSLPSSNTTRHVIVTLDGSDSSITVDTLPAGGQRSRQAIRHFNRDKQHAKTVARNLRRAKRRLFLQMVDVEEQEKLRQRLRGLSVSGDDKDEEFRRGRLSSDYSETCSCRSDESSSSSSSLG